MGDRNNPIKFGPEWLRNLARDSPSSSTEPGTSTGSARLTGRMAVQSIRRNHNQQPNTQTSTTRVQLAKLRYGREEMLALYDRNLEPPAELKAFELLYSPRGKPPFALSTSFEDDTRGDSLRGPSLTTPPIPTDRFGSGRQGISDRSRSRGYPSFSGRQNNATRHAKNLSNASHHERENDNAYGETSSNTSNRSWNTSHSSNSMNKNSDGNEWTTTKPFKRSKSSENLMQKKKIQKSRSILGRQFTNYEWPGSTISWRRPQTSREEENEWRSDNRSRTSDDNSRSMPRWVERDRERNDRTHKERPQSWHSNKRNLTPDSSEDALPEWAVDNVDTYQGTFDSSGAFHGYSSDDSNIPKTPTESQFVLSRSQTHGDFSRFKSVEEGDEWWTSEKATKLSVNKFNAIDMKFKKQISLPGSSENGGISSELENVVSKDTMSEDQDKDNTDSNKKVTNKKTVSFDPRPFLSKRFDPIMRSNIKAEESENEKGDFKSVIITPHNSLRQQHQNLVNINEFSTSHAIARTGNEVINDLEAKEIAQENNIINSTPSPTFISCSQMPPNQIQTTTINTLTSNISVPTFGLPGPTASRPTGAEILAERQRLHSLNTLPPPNLGLRMPFAGNQSLGFSMPTPRFGSVSSVRLNDNQFPVYSTDIPVGPQIDNQNSGRNLLYLVQGNNSNDSIPKRTLQIAANSDVSPQMSAGPGPTPIFPTPSVHMLSAQNFGQVGFGPMQYESRTPPATPPPPQNLDQQWYYQDPEKNIQGPFSALDMANWHRAGYFDSTILVRQASEPLMRPLGSYGAVPPFMMALGKQHYVNFQPVQKSPAAQSRFDIINADPGFIRQIPPFGEQADSLWGQRSSSSNMGWMRSSINPAFGMCYWDAEPIIMPNSSLPDTKDMKTEDQILAQIRATQNITSTETIGRNIATHLAAQNIIEPVAPQTFLGCNNLPMSLESKLHTNVTPKEEIKPLNKLNPTPTLEELEKLIQKENLSNIIIGNDKKIASTNSPQENLNDINNTGAVELEQKISDLTINSNSNQKTLRNSLNKNAQEPKQQKSNKPEIQDQAKAEKNGKSKESSSSKSKNKNNKNKDEKEEESLKQEKKPEEVTPIKFKKEDKPNKKDAEKDKKVQFSGLPNVGKNQEKGPMKKKTEEDKFLQEEDKKGKEPESNEVNKDFNIKPAVAVEKEYASFMLKTAPIIDINKKSPWNSEDSNAYKFVDKEGLSLTQIQRMERMKKMEQQQQMMQLLAQQQQAVIAKEMEMQCTLGSWGRMKTTNANSISPSFPEIQAETRRKAAVSSIGVVSAEEVTPQPLVTSCTSWGNMPNGGAVGFWDTEHQNQLALGSNDKLKATKVAESAKNKRKSPTPIAKLKKEVSPAHEFESWCITTLSTWNTEIDAPTFTTFLKDIESPYEVKDYIKCYLGDTKDSNDFARQFLEKRSKLLRGGTTTPVDDLCSPAMAVNPKTGSSVENQETKGKGKKSRKNKMQKVDSRILGFSVTAAEDRINVGDIDTA